jgi:hypothetical protein
MATQTGSRTVQTQHASQDYIYTFSFIIITSRRIFVMDRARTPFQKFFLRRTQDGMAVQKYDFS